MTNYIQVMKVVVSIPEELFSKADRLAAERGVSRSQFYTQALRSYLRQQLPDDVTTLINEVVESEKPGQDLAEIAGTDLIKVGRWEW